MKPPVPNSFIPSNYVQNTRGEWCHPSRVVGRLPATQPKPEKFKKPPKRLRQSTKTMNKLEREWSLNLCVCRDHPPIHRGIAFPLANGLKYTPDFFAFEWPALGELKRPTAWEVKGFARDDAVAKLKMFASVYPEIRVLMVWKDKDKNWQIQRILP